jgi:hypothetical protein
MSEERFIDGAIKKALGRRTSGAASSCPDENLLAAYLEHSLSDQEKSRLESHVSDCASCREVLALVMKTAAEELMPVGEIRSWREKKLFFRFSAPLAAAAALVLGIGMATLFLLTRELRKPERTEVAQHTSPASVPASSPIPQARRDASAPPVGPEKGSTPGQAPAPVAKMEAAADEMNRAKDKEGRAEEQRLPGEYAHSPEPERKVSMAERAALNEEANRPAEWEGKSEEGRGTAQARGETSSVKATGGPVGGVVGGILSPARTAEEPAAREVAPQAAVLTADSGDVRTEAQDRVAKPAMKSQRAALSTASASAMESKLRDVIRRVAADEKAGKRSDSATRVIGGRTFELREGFWIDLKCMEDPDAELIELNPGSQELDEVRKAVPGLDELRRGGLPVLLSWSGRICVVR